MGEEMDDKSIFSSKTFWANLIGAIALGAQALTGNPVLGSPETQGVLLALANIVLRSVTRSPVTWR